MQSLFSFHCVCLINFDRGEEKEEELSDLFIHLLPFEKLFILHDFALGEIISV